MDDYKLKETAFAAQNMFGAQSTLTKAPTMFDALDELHQYAFETASHCERVAVRLCGSVPETAERIDTDCMPDGALYIALVKINEAMRRLKAARESLGRIERELP